jgi:fructose-bisphosphate aldolase class 1
MCSSKVFKLTNCVWKQCENALTGSIIKPSFPLPGLKFASRNQYKAEDIAFATATVIARSVPTSVPGVAFLSGASIAGFMLPLLAQGTQAD